ncbi:hypothetical protein B0H13DRAFT_2387812 [Mycena leptocephala]|nr:hypothetical protein B0H13DRAFT_2387812 [Mycena leptocephala]
MLVNTDDGGPGEVYHVMEKAPVSWGPILVLDNVLNTMILYAKVVEHEQALINAAQNESVNSRALTSDNLGAALKALGYSSDKTRYSARQVHMATQEETGPESLETGGIGDLSDSSAEEEGASNEDLVLKQVYATLKELMTKLGKLPPSPCCLCGSEKHWNRECPNYILYNEGVKKNAKIASKNEPSEDDLMYHNLFSAFLNQSLASSAVDFSKMPHFEPATFTTTVGRCKTASHPEEAGMILFEGQPQRTILPVTTSTEYALAGNNDITSGSLAMDTLEDMERTHSLKKRKDPQPSMEEIEDEEDLILAAKPKSSGAILEEVGVEDFSDPEASETPRPRTDWNSKERARKAAEHCKMAEEFWLNDGRMFPAVRSTEEMSEDPELDESVDPWIEESREYESIREAHSTWKSSLLSEGDSFSTKLSQTLDFPGDLIPIRLHKRRTTDPGRSAMGVSVLSMKGSVGSKDGEIIDLRLDTCADITLISEEYYLRLPNHPSIRQGLPMKLVQLTQEEEGIKGYILVSIFMLTEEGELIETEAEAYVVPGMSVPILLGEDYQLNYELALTS